MKLGIYGGSFNPLHEGHIAVAEAVRAEYGLDCLLLMVAGDPPHKALAGHVEGAKRLEMVRRALQGRPKLEGFACASALELRREGKSYTVDTVRSLRDIFAGAEIYCVVGTDMLFDLPNWREAAALMQLCGFIAVGRGGALGDREAQAAYLRESYGANILLSAFTGPELSSTEIRARIGAAQSVRGLVPAAVEAYIYEEGLYLPADFCAMQQKLRAELSPERYAHSMGTVRAAIELAERFGADGEKARLAALLHDCAKMDRERQQALVQQYGLDITDILPYGPGLIHGPLGAEHARRAYGVEDGEALDAIACHTLCRKGMTALDKIVYLADKLEPGRDYEGVEELRAVARISLDGAVRLAMEQGIAFVEKKGAKLHPGVLAARAELIKTKA